MAFKEEKVSFTPKTKFRDELAGFVSDEAGFVTGSGNEAASANLDELIEKAVTVSANKNKSQIKFLSKEQKEQKIEISTQTKDITESIQLKEQLEEKLEGAKAELKEMIQKNQINPSNPSFSKEEIALKKEEIHQQERFVKEKDVRIAEKQTELVRTKDTKQAHKKEMQKARKKAATKTSVAGLLRAKKGVANDLAGGGANSGDAFTDAKSGLLGTVMEVMNPMHYFKAWLAKIGALIAPYILLFFTFVCVITIVISLMLSILAPLAEIGNAITNFFSGITVDSDTFTNVAMTEEEIEGILAEIECDDTQTTVLKYALSKVGYPYSQENRTSGTAYDCSSLAYYAWLEAGIDISGGSGYPPSAAEGARMLKEAGKTVASDTFDLKPGDLIYYGGKANGRYLGIYHVAIYTGNGKAVEALSTDYGVVYQNVRTKNIIMVCRPS